MFEHRAGGGRKAVAVPRHRGLELARRAAAQRDERLIHRARQQLRLGIAFGRHHRHCRHHKRALEHGRGNKPLAIKCQRGIKLIRREMRGKGKRQRQGGGERRPEQARTKDPQRDRCAVARGCPDPEVGFASE